ncbi:MAG: hypothetical protein FWE05_11425, partial [Defluviitaleaceae bacterium]|nr:hypothetical protein [Defluviitaleaceae bacterium]
MIKNMIDEIGVMMIDTPYIVSLRSKKAHLSNSDKKRLLKKLIHFREMNANEIINIIKIYAIWEPDEAIYEARKKGVFRYRAHGFHGNVVLNVLNELILCQSMFNFSEETYSFLERKISLCWLYDYYALTEKRLIKYIKKSHKNRKRIIRNRYHVETALFKELLVYIDVMFGNLDHAHDNDAIMAHLHKNSLDDYGQEEISLAISYIIFLYEKVIGIKQDVVYFVDTKKIKSREMDSYILEACKLIEMEEWELAIDYFDYSANFNGNEWVIEDDGSNMEKSIRAGYVQRYSQEHIYNIRNKDIEAIKMGDISASVKENLADKILEKVNDGELTRYRFRIPKLIFSYFSTENHTMLFHEEIMQIGYFARELCMDFDELCNKKITKNCTLLDLVLFKRFFSLMGYIISEFLTEKKDESETVYLSLIPGISEKTLLGYANIFVNDIEKSKELLDLLVFNSATKLDLQYTPMIRASSTLLHPNFLFISSNLLRNVIAHSYYVKNQYPNDDGGLESLVSICEK